VRHLVKDPGEFVQVDLKGLPEAAQALRSFRKRGPALILLFNCYLSLVILHALPSGRNTKGRPCRLVSAVM